MGIPIGKLALYVAGAGIHPSKCLPISLDVGTDNPDLLADPLYLGYPKKRLRGRDYDEFIEAFVRGVREVFPRAILQWEDFHKDRAFLAARALRAAPAVLQRRHPGHRERRRRRASSRRCASPKQRMADQRVVFVGAGAACTGIARLCAIAMRADGADEATVRRAIFALDSRGLLHDGRTMDEPHKRELAVPRAVMTELGLDPNAALTPLDVIRAVKPTILVGATARAGTFTQEMLETMARHVDAPDRPAAQQPDQQGGVHGGGGASAGPTVARSWRPAARSPTSSHDGKRHVIGQANNVFIFPGVGLGAAIAEAREVTTEMFHIASATLARLVEPGAPRRRRDLPAPERAAARELRDRVRRRALRERAQPRPSHRPATTSRRPCAPRCGTRATFPSTASRSSARGAQAKNL